MFSFVMDIFNDLVIRKYVTDGPIFLITFTLIFFMAYKYRMEMINFYSILAFFLLLLVFHNVDVTTV